MAKRLSAAEKVSRDSRVVADRVRGLTWVTIAQRHELSERHCRELWSEYRANQPSSSSVDPVAAAEEMLERFEAVVEDAALLSEATANDAVKVAAIKLRLAGLKDQLELRMALGLLPPLRRLEQELDIRQLTRAILQVFERHEVPLEAQRSLRILLSEASLASNVAGSGA